MKTVRSLAAILENTTGALVGAVVVAATATTATAGIVPDFGIEVEIDGGGAMSVPATATDIGSGLWNFQGGLSEPGTGLSFDINASDDPTNALSGAFVGSNFTIENESLETQEYRISISLGLANAAPDATYGGSAGFALTGTDGLLQSIPGSPLWLASADGAPVDSLFEDPMFLMFSGDGAASTSDDLVPGTLPGVSDSISIDLAFRLSPGDTVIVSGVFGIVPAPSAVLLLAGPLLAGRRRRSID